MVCAVACLAISGCQGAGTYPLPEPDPTTVETPTYTTTPDDSGHVLVKSSQSVDSIKSVSKS
jgi:hypothetical protein